MESLGCGLYAGAAYTRLALNVDLYTNHPKFSYFPYSGRHPNTVFSLCLTGSSHKIFHDSDQNRPLAIWSERGLYSLPTPTVSPGLGILCMVLSTLERRHSLQITFSCFGREKAVIPKLGHDMSQIILSPCTQ
ncbi:hypothetical protein P5673_018468 [Acropora cervicornis]|uniref:Uncharacterized protein n=1 Tax=Acropora cervicornis TaxID=6130 RepID=A0AAD9V2L8_ACRCE|nr:hypothetical protein P5673_018468 [Acropora cervicornis]